MYCTVLQNNDCDHQISDKRRSGIHYTTTVQAAIAQRKNAVFNKSTNIKHNSVQHSTAIFCVAVKYQCYYINCYYDWH